MKIGDKVWRFDRNRRIYTKDTPNGFGRIIYEEHFYLCEIIGETSRSWIVSGGYGTGDKFSKKDPIGLYTNEQKAADIWDHENRHKIVSTVQHCTPETLKQIADLIGYEEEQNDRP